MFRRAMKLSTPIVMSYVFVAITCGLLYRSMGYTLFQVALASTIIYSGSMQIVLAPLMFENVSLISIAFLTFLISGRHLFYSIALLKRYKGSFFKRLYLGFTLTDEVYSVIVSKDEADTEEERKLEFYIHLFGHLLWIGSTSLGYLFGELIPFDLRGIEFSSAVFFTIVVVNQFLASRDNRSFYIGLVLGLLGLAVFGPHRFIFPSLLGSVIVLILLGRKEGKLDGDRL